MENLHSLYLKRIDICGFKSFAEPTSILFSPGLNVVLIPDAGKSDLLDALLWAMRRYKCNDFGLLFSATEKHPATDEAEVRLTLKAAGSEIEIVRMMRRGHGGCIDIEEPFPEILTQVQTVLTVIDKGVVSLGGTIILFTNDSSIAAFADRLIDITDRLQGVGLGCYTLSKKHKLEVQNEIGF